MGDRFHADFELDIEPRGERPREPRRGARRGPIGYSAIRSLVPSRRHMDSIADTKTAETRQRQIAEIVGSRCGD